MELLENNGTQKRRMPRAGTLILAAALAVGCVLSIAAGLPARVYNFASGTQIVSMPGTNEVNMTVGGEVAPVKAEDGRLWFEADGRRVDITDKVDENTPYIYERTDSDTGEKGYVIVGGTTEDFGWCEFFVIDGSVQASSGNHYADYLTDLPDGSVVPFFELTDEQKAQLESQRKDDDDDSLTFITARIVNRPWFQTALDQLGLEY